MGCYVRSTIIGLVLNVGEGTSHTHISENPTIIYG